MPFAVAAGIAAVGGIASAVIGGNAAKSAAQTQANAANQASQIQLQMFNQDKADLAPWVTAGNNALAAYQSGLGLLPGQTPGQGSTAGFMGSPGYQFQRNQGLDAISNQASRAGGVLSGNVLKQLQTYGTGLANQDWYNYLSQLQGLSNTGENAAATTGAQGIATGNQIGANTIGAGNAIAAGTVGQSNALTGGLNTIANSGMLYALLNRQGGGFSGGGLFGGGAPGGDTGVWDLP